MREWNADRSFAELTLIDLLEQRAKTGPARPAVTFTGGPGAPTGTLDFATLSQKVRGLAALLQKTGTTGQRAFLLFPSGLDYVVGLLGCVYAGIIAVPVNLPGPARVSRVLPKIAGIAADCRPAFLLTTEEIKIGSADAIAQMEQDFGCVPISIDTAVTDPETWERPAITPADIAFLQYTSGSTGQPKGVINRHEGLIANNEFLTCLTRPHDKSVTVSWLPLFHDMGLIMGILNPLIYGAHAVLMPPAAFARDPLSWLDLATQYRATVLPGPAFGFQSCIDAATPERLARIDLSSVEAAVPAAEPVSPVMVRDFVEQFGKVGLREIAMKPSYGLAETTLIAAGSARDQKPVIRRFDTHALEENRLLETDRKGDGSRAYVGNGAEFGGQLLLIVDPETAAPLAEGNIGEIWVSGPAVASGYWNNEADTRDTFGARIDVPTDDPAHGRKFVRTGDVGALFDGELFITGRLKDMMLFRGRCHYPNDIETTVADLDECLVRHGGAAFSISDGFAEKLVIVQEVTRGRDGADGDYEKLILDIRRAVGNVHEVPVHAVVLIRKGTLRKTTSGKIRRSEMRRAYIADELTVVAQRRFDEGPEDRETRKMPRDAENVGNLIRTLVGRAIGGVSAKSIDPQTGFFDQGMDSIAVLEVARALETEFGRSLPESLLFDNPTVDRLTAFLTGAEDTGKRKDSAGMVGASDPVSGAASEPIAVIGIGCLMPGDGEENIRDAEGFFDFLMRGGNAISTAPRDRYDIDLDIPGYGGFVRDVDRFDGPFFGISPREAISTDPQQRLLLEVAWHGLEDAGIVPSSLRESATGVFVGIGTNDYGHIPFLSGDPEDFDAYYGTGNSTAAAAGRISYCFGFEGPAMSIDTACSSSLVSVHLAMQSLRAGEIDLALAGGVKLQLVPEIDLALNKAGMLAPDGQCKTFDAEADGYVRGEGCALIVLKRLDDALRDGDSIRAVMRQTTVRQDGQRAGLTVPDGMAQGKLIRRNLIKAGVKPAEIDYVEAHGTGTRLGDPIEYGALVDVFGGDPERRAPLWLGSVKTNIGHLEAGAGIAGLLKVILAVEHAALPPHLNLNVLSPAIDLDAIPARIPQRASDWPETSGRPRRAAVTSFGFTGTIAHAIVEQSPQMPPSGNVVPSFAPDAALPAYLMAVSAASDEALDALCSRYAERLAAEETDLRSFLNAVHCRREHLGIRRAFVASDRTELIAALSAPVQGCDSGRTRPRIAFLFTGQGAQYARMGRELFDLDPAFRSAFAEAVSALDRHMDVSVRDIVFGDEDPRLDQTAYTQPALFAIGFALARMWQSYGIEPSFIAGHSIGEIAASVIAGALTVDAAARIVAIRGQLMQSLPEGGAMAAVRMPLASAETAIAGYENCLSVAAINGPQDIVLSGTAESLETVTAELEKQGISVRRLTVSHAFHSPLMTPILDDFASAVSGLNAHETRIPFFSTVLSREVDHRELGSETYWRSHARQPVRFSDAVSAALAADCDILLEIGPGTTLMSTVRRGLADGRIDATPELVSSLRPGTHDLTAIQQAVARLYECGICPDWKRLSHGAIAPSNRLPLYPFDRHSYWFDVHRSPSGKRGGADRAKDTPAGIYAMDWIPVAELSDFGPLESGRKWILIGDESTPCLTTLHDGLVRCGQVVRTVSLDALDRLDDAVLNGALVVFLPGLDLDDDRPDRVSSAVAQLSETARILRDRAKIAALMVPTFDVNPARNDDENAIVVPAAAPAALWGAGRSICFEAPGLPLRLIDLPGGDAAEPSLQAACRILPELLAEHDQITLHGDALLAPRLRAVEPPEADPLVTRTDGFYLIAGGAGALGRRLTEWLAAKGVNSFLWLGRSEPGAIARDMIARMKDAGVEIRWRRSDIADAGDMGELLGDLSKNAERPLRGILHCAGHGRFSTLDDLTRDDIDAVMAAKVTGSRHLRRIAAGHDLDMFVLFSSISGIWGSRLQIPYGAANAYQDGLARMCRAQGVPAISVAWGPWGGGAGMSDLDDSLLEYLRRAGIHRREPETYLAALEPLFALSTEADRADYVCADVTWSDFLPLYQAMAGTDLFEFCGTERDRSGRKTLNSDAANEAANAILALSGDARRDGIIDFIIGTIAEILRIDAHRLKPEQDLIVMGLDSILVMDFVRRMDSAFGISCALRQVFDTPTPIDLAAYVDGLIDNRAPSDGAQADVMSDAMVLVADRENLHEPFPLTELQHAYWAGRSGAFAMGNIACHAYLETESRLTGPELAEKSWNALVRRHDCLRLVIDNDGRQRILPSVPHYSLQVVDLSGATQDEIDGHIENWREELSHQVLSPDRWPLFDVRATRLPGGMTRLHFSIDMLINDATSSQILWDELGAICAAGGTVEATDLKPYEISFRDYVVAKFNRDATRQAEYDRARDYWLAKLPAIPPAPDLPLAVAPESLKHPSFSRFSHTMDEPAWSEVKRRGASFGLTPASLLISAFADTLAAWSNNPAFTINLTIFDRRPWHEDVARLVGDFTSVTLLSVDRSTSAGFAENAVRLHRDMVDDLQHRACSAIDVMRQMNAQSDGRRHMMPVVFTSQFGISEPTKGTGADDPLGNVTYAITQTPQVWIDQQVTEHDGALVFNWDVVDGLFPADMVSDMFDAYRALLERLAADPESWQRPVGPLLPARQLAVRETVNATRGPVPRRLLHAPFLTRADKAPDKPALFAADGRSWTYGELSVWSNRIAHALLDGAAADDRIGERVAILMEKGPEQVAAALGILMTGRVYVPLDPAWPDNRILSVLESAGISDVLAQPWRHEELQARFGGGTTRILDVAETALTGYSGNAPASPRVAVTDPAYVIYTSGSTGTPKGVVIDHRGALNTVLDVNRRFGVAEGDRIFGLSALSFDLSVYDIFGTFAAGAALVLPEEIGRRDPAHWADLCKRYGVTVWNSVPALLDMMLVENDPDAIGGLQKVFLSGDWVPLGLPDRLFGMASGTKLVCMGGATEASIWSNYFEVESVDPAWKSVPYGYPLTNQGYRVLDGAMADRPDWVTGDLYISGIGLAHGYDGDPEKSAASFLSHPADGVKLYRTGDLARYWPDGIIEFQGRKDNQVKVGGHRIELGEIESALVSHPGIRDAVADAVGRDGEIKRLIAWVTLNADTGSDHPIVEEHEADPHQTERTYGAVLGELRKGQDSRLPAGDPVGYEAFWNLMDDIAVQCIRDSFALTGLFADREDGLSKDEICARMAVDADFRSVVENWIDILASAGYLGKSDDRYLPVADPKTPTDIWDALLGRVAEIGLPSDPILRLRQGAAARLDIVRGSEDALGMFYGADDALSPEHLSRLNPLHAGAIAGMCGVLRHLCENGCQDRPLRILEIGGRSGLSACELLSGLDADRIEYMFSDTSRLFLDQARQSFERLPMELRNRIGYSIFDPDRDAQMQGIGDQEFDVILAFNALHRSRDIPALIGNLSGMLTPGGLVVAPEITRNSRLQAVTVALLEQGYAGLQDWRCETRLPLVGAGDWVLAFDAAGFAHADAVAPGGGAGTHYGYHVLLAGNRNRVARFSVDAVQDYLGGRLPAYMLPQQILHLEQLPLGANGKVDRKKLPRPAAVAIRRRGGTEARTDAEKTLVPLWCDLLHIDSVGREDNFFDLGGDSLIAVRMVERVRAELGRMIAVRDLFEEPTLQGLAVRFADAPECDDRDDLPELVARPGQRYEPFPLTDVQQAYWIGRQMINGLGGVSTYLYTEIDVENLSLERLESAWNRLVDRHEMLRAVIRDDGTQIVLPKVPHYVFDHVDLRGAHRDMGEETVRAWRAEMSHQLLDTARWPVFDIRAVTLPDGSVRLMIGLDNIICDGRSMQLLLREWSLLARSDGEHEMILSPLQVSFRDYVLAEEGFRDSNRMKRSLTYWLNRMPSLPGGPDLPLAMRPGDVGIPEFERFEARLGRADWGELKRICSEKGITPNALLMTAYGLCLANWSRIPDFTLNLTLFNRQPLHRDIDDLVGDFTSLVLFAFQNVPTGSFADAVRHVQGTLWRDLDHMQVSAIRVIREYSRSRSLSSAPSYPVVFTSGLGVDAQAGDVVPLGQFGYGITQTPQVWIDHQVVERGGELIFNWDVVQGLFPDTLIASVFDSYCDLLHRLVHEDGIWEQPLSGILPAHGFADFASEIIETGNGAASTDPAGSDVRIAELEEMLCDRIGRQLGQSGSIARDRTFFELGLNSITLMRIRQELQREKGLHIQVVDIFAHPTVASLARRLASGTGGTPRPVRHDHENVPATDKADRRSRRRALKKRDASNAEILS